MGVVCTSWNVHSPQTLKSPMTPYGEKIFSSIESPMTPYGYKNTKFNLPRPTPYEPL